MPQTVFARARSSAGAALAALGMFIFHGNLDRVAEQIGHILGPLPAKALGVLPTVILTLSRLLQAADHQGLPQMLLQCLLTSCWPLLLVIFGTVMSHDDLVNRVTVPGKDCRTVDLAARHSTTK